MSKLRAARLFCFVFVFIFLKNAKRKKLHGADYDMRSILDDVRFALGTLRSTMFIAVFEFRVPACAGHGQAAAVVCGNFVQVL